MAVVDSYSEANQSAANTYSSGSGTANMLGQGFTGDGNILDSAQFYLKKQNSPTGTIKAYIYAHTGTFGTDGEPTGAVLATSATYDVTALTTSYQLITFTFSGAERIALDSGTKYFVVAEFSIATSGADNVSIGTDNTSPSHAGNLAFFQSAAWTADATRDLIFYVNGSPPSSPSISVSASPSVTPSVSVSRSPSLSPSTSVSPSAGPTHLTVMKVAKPNVNVLTNSDPEKFKFSSEYGTLKYFDKEAVPLSFTAGAPDNIGSVQGTYTHNLGYYPYVEAFVRVYIGSPSGNYEYVPFAGAGATVLYSATMKITTTTIVLYGMIDGVSSSTWHFDFLLFVYKNTLSL